MTHIEMTVAKILIPIVLAAATLMASAATPYSTNEARAARAYDGGEWASAAALYQIMLSERPDSVSSYARTIVASTLIADTVMPTEMVERAMAHGIGFDDVLDGVRSESYAVGHSEIYSGLLKRLQQSKPYIRRAIDRRLLDYYLYRNDGARIIEYATVMLHGLPDDVTFLGNLAEGYVLIDDYDKAEATWLHILEIQPREYDATVNLATYYISVGRNDKAQEYINRAQSIRPTPWLTAKAQQINNQKDGK